MPRPRRSRASTREDPGWPNGIRRRLKIASTHVFRRADTPETQGFAGVVATPGAALPNSSPFHGGVSRSPRGAIIADLSGLMVRALEAGDVAAARVAHDSIGRRLGSEGRAPR